MGKKKEIETIHLSTLKTVLAEVIRDSKSNEPNTIANFMVDHFFDGLGAYGKIGNKRGDIQLYSQYACLDFPYEMGRQVFILEG